MAVRSGCKRLAGRGISIVSNVTEQTRM
jgi:hypothetical protein